MKSPYEGHWADGDFEGTGKLYADTALVAVDPHAFATDGFSRQIVAPFLRIQGTFKGGRANGPVTVFGGMNTSVPWPRIYPELFWSINRSMKLFEGTVVDEIVEGEGTQYHDAQDCLQMARRERGPGPGFRERWEELMRENPVFYEGQFKNGKKEGRGTMRMVDGATYTGEFKEDNRSGFGTQTWLDGVVYEGQWADDKPNGEGTMTRQGSIHTGQFRAGDMTQGTIRYENGDVYTGEGGGDGLSRPNGSGEMIYANGDKYTGMWRAGERHGEGECLYADNSVYKGTWVEDKRHGKGTFTVEGRRRWR